MTTRDELVKMMREDDLQAWVIDVAHLRRWTVAHFRPAQNKRGDWRLPVAADGKGFHVRYTEYGNEEDTTPEFMLPLPGTAPAPAAVAAPAAPAGPLAVPLTAPGD